MTRYVAFLRGVSPMNARMPDLKAAFESAGFTDVRTVLASGNVAFDARRAGTATLERRAEAAMQAALGHAFGTLVRSGEHLRQLLDDDPFAAFDLPPAAKRVVTFLRRPAEGIALPPEQDGVRMLAVRGTEVCTAYVADEKGPVFMRQLERTFGRDITTRTWDTVRRCAKA